MQPVHASLRSAAHSLFGGEYPRVEPAESHPQAAPPRARPVVGPEGQLYTLEGGTLTARRPDGQMAWTKTFTGELHPPLVDPEGHLYLVAREGAVRSLDAQGQLRWERQIRGTLREAPTLAGNHTLGLLSRHEMGLLVNLDTRTGTSRYERPMLGQILMKSLHGGPEGNLYFFNNNDHMLTCYDSTGRSPWRYPVGDYIGSIAIGPDGTLFVPRMFGDVLAIKDGQKLWSQRPGSSTPQVNEQAVVRSEKTVLRLDPGSGNPVWSQQLPQPPQGEPVSDQEGHTFLKGTDTIYALSTGDGQPRASFPLGTELSDPAPLPDGALVSDGQGTVHRLSLRPEHYRLEDNEPSAGVLTEEGRILVGGVSLPTRRKA